MQILEKKINKLNPELTKGNFNFVLKECLKLRKTYSTSSFLDNYIGLIYQSIGQLDEAEEYFLSSLKINSNN